MPLDTKLPLNGSRRGFLKTAGAGIAAGLLAHSAPSQAPPAPASPLSRASIGGPLTEQEKAARIATNCYGLRQIFKSRLAALAGKSEKAVNARKKYGEITVLDLPAFTRDHFPGVVRMDLLALFFGDAADDSQYRTLSMGESGRTLSVFDPTSAGGKRWLDTMAAKQAAIGVRCHHISNDAVQDLSDPDPARRRAGVELGKQWLDAAAVLGAKSMRLNTGGPTIAPAPIKGTRSPSTNDALVRQMRDCIESYKELADYAGNTGVKVTIENHWGIAANPINIRTIIEQVNSPFCEASPDFGNWEHEFLIHHAVQDLAPYAHTTVHAKYWDRWTAEQQDVQKDVRIMLNSGYTGVFALEYEDGPWDSVEGSQYLYREVMAAL